jgi:poly(glycerol-phosphate) alpha-glucosyltransferase
MKILHVVQSLDPAWGGIARVLPSLAKELRRAGCTCRIATLAGGRYGCPPDITGVEVLTFDAPDRSRLGCSPTFNAEIESLCRWADCVHLHGLWTGQNGSAGRAARRLGRSYIMTPHSMMMPWAWRRSAWKKRPIGWLFEHRNLRRAALIHALADGEAAAIAALGFNDRIEVVPNGIHAADYAAPPAGDDLTSRFPAWRDRKLLVFIGRLHFQKGIIQAMKAALDCFAVADRWHFVIAGPDELGMRAALSAGVARKGMAERVTFAGLLSRVEIRALLARADLLIQPSLSEGLSMSILEALASGVPVLISDACNMPEVARAGAGRVVAPDRRAVAAALRELVTATDDARCDMGRRGRELVRERFDWSVVIPRYRAMYDCAAAGAAAR